VKYCQRQWNFWNW